MTLSSSQAANGRDKAKSSRPFRPHLDRLRQALGSLGIELPSAKIQKMAAAFYGFGTINALAAALKEGQIAIPACEEATGHESLVMLRDPETGKVFGITPESASQQPFLVTPYGTLVTPPIPVRNGWPNETMAAVRLRTARAAFTAYTGRAFANTDDEESVADLIADLMRFTDHLTDGERSQERHAPDEMAAAALRHFQRECLGEAANEEYPDLMVSVDALDWDMTWTRDSAPCVAAAKAYAPASFDSEPDYTAGDLIGDLLHMVAALDHGSAIETLRKALQSLNRDKTMPQVTVYMRVGR